MSNQDKQKSHRKLKDRVTRTPLKSGMNPSAPDGKAHPAPLVRRTRCVNLLTNLVISHEWGNDTATVFSWSVCTNPGTWVVMCLSVEGMSGHVFVCWRYEWSCVCPLKVWIWSFSTNFFCILELSWQCIICWFSFYYKF